MNQFIDILLPIFAGIALIWFQIVLSKNNNKRAAWLFPAIFFCMSIVYLLFIFVFAYPHMASGSISLGQIFSIFLVFNIPTLVLSIIHIGVRKVCK